MHSDDIKEEIQGLRRELDKLGYPQDFALKKVAVKTELLKADALNELNWSLYFIKEELKALNKNIQMLR